MRRRPFGLESALPRGRRRIASRIRIEALEDRRLLATFTVVNTDDAGTGSLREAIALANTTAGSDVINFAIPGSGVRSIDLTTAPLPTITESVTIDGTSQATTDAVPFVTPLIQINGSALPAGTNDGLSINITTGTAGAAIRGLAIGGFSGSGVAITGIGRNAIQQSFLGTNAAGTAAAANGTGILISGSPNNSIGGLTATDRNVISGNAGAGVSITGSPANGNTLRGNSIGTDAGGNLAIPNGNGVVISDAANNTVGGTTNTARNIISGNTGSGVLVTGAAAIGTLIQGNTIGLSTSGAAALPNAVGVQLANGATGTLVLGTTAAPNVISGNTQTQITLVLASNNSIQGNRLGLNAAGTAALGGTQATTAGISLEIGATGNTIGGTTAADANVIGGSTGPGILIRGITTNATGSAAGNNAILGNFIGALSVGATAVANAGGGIVLRDGTVGNTIGGTTTGSVRNVISGNTGAGVSLVGVGTTGNVVQANFIGVQGDGTTSIPNSGDGIFVDGASDAQIGGIVTGAGNTIANNGGAGVFVNAGTGIGIRRNSIVGNGALGIDLAPRGVNENAATNPGVGPNNLQNFPVLTRAVTANNVTNISGTLQSAANTLYTIEFYSNTTPDPSGHGEGQTFVGTTTVLTDATGRATFNVPTLTAVPSNAVISATAIDPSGNTSEFSANLATTTPTADIALTVTAAPEPVAAGGVLTFTVTVANVGSTTASNVVVTDTLPTGVNFVGATSSAGTVAQAGQLVTTSVGSLAAGATATITITAVAPTVGTLTNRAAVTLTETDPNPANNTATSTSTVVAGVDLAVTTTNSPSTGTVGQPVTITFTVTNNSTTNTATNVVLTAPLPSGATVSGSSASQGTADALNGMLSAALGSLAPGTSATVSLVLNPSSVGTLSTTATVASDQVEVLPSSNTVTSTVPVVASTGSSGFDGPKVIGLNRSGIHSQPANIGVSFDGPLDESSAVARRNYRLVNAGRDGKFGTRDDVAIRIASIGYNPVNRLVTLRTRRQLSLKRPVQITVIGTGTSPVKGLNGLALDGNNDGQPGGNFVRVFNQVGPGRLSTSALKAAASRAGRSS